LQHRREIFATGGKPLTGTLPAVPGAATPCGTRRIEGFSQATVAGSLGVAAILGEAIAQRGVERRPPRHGASARRKRAIRAQQRVARPTGA